MLHANKVNFLVSIDKDGNKRVEEYTIIMPGNITYRKTREELEKEGTDPDKHFSEVMRNYGTVVTEYPYKRKGIKQYRLASLITPENNEKSEIVEETVEDTTNVNDVKLAEKVEEPKTSEELEKVGETPNNEKLNADLQERMEKLLAEVRQIQEEINKQNAMKTSPVLATEASKPLDEKTDREVDKMLEDSEEDSIGKGEPTILPSRWEILKDRFKNRGSNKETDEESKEKRGFFANIKKNGKKILTALGVIALLGIGAHSGQYVLQMKNPHDGKVVKPPKNDKQVVATATPEVVKMPKVAKEVKATVRPTATPKPVSKKLFDINDKAQLSAKVKEIKEEIKKIDKTYLEDGTMSDEIILANLLIVNNQYNRLPDYGLMENKRYYTDSLRVVMNHYMMKIVDHQDNPEYTPELPKNPHIVDWATLMLADERAIEANKPFVDKMNDVVIKGCDDNMQEFEEALQEANLYTLENLDIVYHGHKIDNVNIPVLDRIGDAAFIGIYAAHASNAPTRTVATGRTYNGVSDDFLADLLNNNLARRTSIEFIDYPELLNGEICEDEAALTYKK